MTAYDVTGDLARGDLAIEFVGTLHGRSGGGLEELRTPSDLAAWMRTTGVVDAALRVSETDLEAAIALREAIYRSARGLVTRTPPTPGDIDLLNRAAAAAPPMPHVAGSGRIERTGDLPAALSAVARDAVAWWELDENAVLKWCDDDTCRRVFIDRSRGHRRRWCGMANCGDRAKARAYRSRRRSAAADGERPASP